MNRWCMKKILASNSILSNTRNPFPDWCLLQTLWICDLHSCWEHWLKSTCVIVFWYPTWYFCPKNYSQISQCHENQFSKIILALWFLKSFPSLISVRLVCLTTEENVISFSYLKYATLTFYSVCDYTLTYFFFHSSSLEISLAHLNFLVS